MYAHDVGTMAMDLKGLIIICQHNTGMSTIFHDSVCIQFSTQKKPLYIHYRNQNFTHIVHIHMFIYNDNNNSL